MKTKSFIIAAMAACIGTVCLGSCNQEEEIASQGGDNELTKLKVTTRTEGETTRPKDAIIYLFNKAGICTNIITSAELNNSKGTQIDPGDYKLVAIGSNNLSNYDLPNKLNANDSSVIKLNDGASHSDLMIATDNITMTEGETTQANITLSREVICTKNITIEKVPTDITKAELTISPMYKEIRFDGKYTNDIDSIKINLDKDTEEGKWIYKGDSIFSLPSKGNPTIKLTLASSGTTKEYTITGNKPLTKNHLVKLDIVYNEALKAYLSTNFTQPEWEGTETINCEISDKNITNVESDVIPVRGKTYNKYYVVSVDYYTQTAVLLRMKGDDNIDSKEKMEAAAALIKIIDGAVSKWRLPNEEEIRYVLNNCALAEGDTVYSDQVKPGAYYCMIDGKISTANLEIDKDNNRQISMNPDSGYSAATIFRPVIEIKY